MTGIRVQRLWGRRFQRRVGIWVFFCLVVFPVVRAEYLMALSSGGRSSVELTRGQSVAIDLDLFSAGGGDQQNVAILRLLVSAPDLVYVGYEWFEPYRNGDDSDDSSPGHIELPLRLTNSANGSPPVISLSNFIPADSAQERFQTGRLLRLQFQVPEDYSGPDSIVLTAVAETFADGFRRIAVRSIPNFEIRIVPRPIDQPDLDDDGDGLPNLVEYALGLDPKDPGRPSMTRTSPGLPVFAIETSEAGPSMTFTFRTHPGRTEVGLQVQSSEDLIHWRDEPDFLVEGVGDAEIRRAQITLSGSGRFVRLLAFLRGR